MDDYDTACQVLLSLCETIGIRLRKAHVQCNCICVELRDYNFRNLSHQLTLAYPTDSTTIIYENACKLLRDFWDLTPVRLIGVRTSHISTEDYCQFSLFQNQKNEKLERMDRAIDSIREKFGVDSIKRASFLKEDSIVDHAAGKSKHLNAYKK